MYFRWFAVEREMNPIQRIYDNVDDGSLRQVVIQKGVGRDAIEAAGGTPQRKKILLPDQRPLTSRSRFGSCRVPRTPVIGVSIAPVTPGPLVLQEVISAPRRSTRSSGARCAGTSRVAPPLPFPSGSDHVMYLYFQEYCSKYRRYSGLERYFSRSNSGHKMGMVPEACTSCFLQRPVVARLHCPVRP